MATVAAIKSGLFRAAALLTLAWLPQVGLAQDPTVRVAEMEALRQAYDEQVARASAPHLAAVAELDKKYLARLAIEQQTAQQGGKLAEALAIQAEREAVASGGGVPPEDAADIPVALKKMRATYRTEIAKLEGLRAMRVTPLRVDFARKLDTLMTNLTKEGKLKEALTVRTFRDSLSAAQEAAPADSSTLSAGKVMSFMLPGGLVMRFCYCPAGSFMMGSPPDEKDRRANEDQIKVSLSKGFWMAQTECTQAQWEAVMGDNPSRFKGDSLPVEQVSWNDAQKFITKLNDAKTIPAGWKVTLPTEAQWEYACRAGTKTPFGFGNSLNAKQANIAQALGGTSVVASYAANAWGLYDMHGNVWEWCEDFYGDREKHAGGTDPKGKTSGSLRVRRGGGWYEVAGSCRAACRGDYGSPDTGRLVGFRLIAIQPLAKQGAE